LRRAASDEQAVQDGKSAGGPSKSDFLAALPSRNRQI